MIQEKKVTDIAHKIFYSSERNSYMLNKFSNDLSEISPKDFLVHNFIQYPESYIAHDLMFAYKMYWENLTLNDWTDVIKKISNHELALYSCLSFLYRDIGIDSICLYTQMLDLDETIKNNVLRYFRERPGVLSVIEKYYKFGLERYGLDMNSFDEIRERLIAEGAILARKIMPKIIKLSDDDDFIIHTVTEEG